MAQDIRRSIKGLLGGIAGLAGSYRRNFRSKMIIVAFHRVNDAIPEDGLTCTSAKFEDFCEFFKKYFRVVSFAEQVTAYEAGVDMGGTLSITFDDGYRDNFEVAAPILRRLQLPATFFVTTGFIASKQVPFWDSSLPLPPAWMSWDQVRALASQGFDIGCHTDTHIDMGTSDPETVRRELEVSRQKLQQELGQRPTLFAYPFGGREHISERSIALVREAGFASCASCYGGTNQPLSDPYSLKRIGIAEWFATPHQFGIELLMGKA
jgi:peptidoglycan/xylan/chitin deacetylase (PgdA/CDA1 family)